MASPVLPAASVARTTRVWLPSPEAVTSSGLAQGVKAAPSRLQVRVTGVSSAEKVTVGTVSGFSCVTVSVTTGGRVSMRTVTGSETGELQPVEIGAGGERVAAVGEGAWWG